MSGAVPRAVLDTNGVVAAVLTPDGAPAAVLEAGRAERFALLVSPAILDEDIGSAALRRRLTVLTNNRRHFELIEGIQLPSA